MFSPEDAEAVRALVAKGSLGGGVFETADCQKTFEALFRDDSGNWFTLTQPKWLG